MRSMLEVLVPCFVISVLYLAGTRLWPQRGVSEMRRAPATAPAPSSDMPSNWIDCVNTEPEPRFWAEYGSGPRVAVYGFPSRGGFYVLRECVGVELDFLGIDRFGNTERPSKSDSDWQAKEEAHCDRMRRLGARWFETVRDELEIMFFRTREDTDPYVSFGWPDGGGVWVINTTYGRASELGTGIIYNAKNMEERCELIKRLGGIFYADPGDCPYLNLD